MLSNVCTLFEREHIYRKVPYVMIQTFQEAIQERSRPSELAMIDRFPFPWFRAMREEAPVFYDKDLRVWSIFRYDDVQQALTDYETFSSYIAEDAAQERTNLQTSDPPYHRQLRTIIQQAFTPRRIAALAPRITEIAHATLDQALTEGNVDIVEKISYPIPGAVISDMLGIPEQYRSSLETFFALPVAARKVSTDLHLPLMDEMHGIFSEVVQQHRNSPQNDLISALLAAQVDGEQLSELEIFDFCVLLYIAGRATTMNLITLTFLCFSEVPDLIEQVREDFRLIPALVEEVLRYYPPVLAFPRRVTRDITLRGQHLHAGDYAAVWFASANHDERVFQEPERFDLSRPTNKHASFGYGTHFCLGAPLARLEAPIVIQAMLERMDNIIFPPHEQLQMLIRWQFFTLAHLPVNYTLRMR